MTETSETDARRVLEIDRYQVLSHPPRADLVALVEVAAQVAAVPMATINLITGSEQHQVATVGFEAAVCRREDSMCNLALEQAAPIIVPDASRDERFCDNPFVTGEIGEVRFYATHQLRTPTGVVVGTLCVFDVEPRELTEAQAAGLAKLADRVVDILELELRTRELAKSVDDLQETRRELERSNASLAAFASQVSHDLRNPLTAVQMSLALLAEQLDDPDTISLDPELLAQALRRATGGAVRMQRLIADLLGYARVGGSLAHDPVDLDVVMREVCDDLEVLLAGAEMTVSPLPTVVGDPVQLRAVLQNVVSNAAKFKVPGGPARIHVGAEREGDHWLLSVADHGLGVPPQDRERVFQPLVRVHAAVEGNGIGLATVRRIMEAHGGRATLGETPGGGTTVMLRLPVEPPAGQPVGPAA